MPKPIPGEADRYTPPVALRQLAQRRPEIEWLCFQPPYERRFYRDLHRLIGLIQRFPKVTEEEWILLFR